MKATELRIGNLVTYNYNQSHRFPESELKYSGTAYPVIGIAEDDIVIKGFAGKCEAFSPIPLTEEWLIKLGFNINKAGMIATKPPYFMLLLDGNKNCSGNGIRFSYEIRIHNPLYNEIEYVHHLQNLYFDLTGEELCTN